MSQCLTKLPYRTKKLAERAAEIYTAQSHRKGSNTRLNGRSYGHNLVYRAYKCRIGDHYHLTTKAKNTNYKKGY